MFFLKLTQELSFDNKKELIPVLHEQQRVWISLRAEVCKKNTVSASTDQIECLTRLYKEKINILQQGLNRQPKTGPGWARSLRSGEQIGVGGRGGADYWAIIRCGIDSVSLAPGGDLTTTGRSVLESTGESSELPATVDGLDVKGDMNATQVNCRWENGKKVLLEFQLTRPITEPGPCAGNFGVEVSASMDGRKIIKSRNLLAIAGWLFWLQ